MTDNNSYSFDCFQTKREDLIHLCNRIVFGKTVYIGRFGCKYIIYEYALYIDHKIRLEIDCGDRMVNIFEESNTINRKPRIQTFINLGPTCDQVFQCLLMYLIEDLSQLTIEFFVFFIK